LCCYTVCLHAATAARNLSDRLKKWNIMTVGYPWPIWTTDVTFRLAEGRVRVYVWLAAEGIDCWTPWVDTATSFNGAVSITVPFCGMMRWWSCLMDQRIRDKMIVNMCQCKLLENWRIAWNVGLDILCPGLPMCGGNYVRGCLCLVETMSGVAYVWWNLCPGLPMSGDPMSHTFSSLSSQYQCLLPSFVMCCSSMSEIVSVTFHVTDSLCLM
jgi:hypothetical protein